MVRHHARRAALAALLLAGGLLAGCSEEQSSASGPPPASTSSGDEESPRYVALGDSYTAAPGVPETDTSRFCMRSDHNYPSLVAAELDATLIDASCSGATTEHMLSPQNYGDQTHPAQFDALDKDVDLVTVGIGGNDFNLFAMMIRDCSQLGAGVQDPDAAPCRDHMVRSGSDELLERVRRIRSRVASVVRGIERRAPDAQVIVVGYPQLVPPRGHCDALPLAPGDYPYVRSINLAMTRALELAAQDTGVDYLDVWKASAGHDVCADDPWVNGQQMAPSAMAFHPFPEEQQAVAQLVLKVVDEDVAARAG